MSTNQPVIGIFDGLVHNAIYFLNSAAKRLEKEPRQSIIDLATSIELFLKARLVLEHWVLIVKKTEQASLVTFQAGAFHSVGMDEAITRLRNVLGLTIGKEEETCFREIREHRNRLVHFMHGAYAKQADPAILASITAEQCRAWFYLHRLLMSRWHPHFVPWTKDIQRVHTRIVRNKEFLHGKAVAIAVDIADQKKKGVRFAFCPSCGYEAEQYTQSYGPLVNAACLVCERRRSLLEVDCPECDSKFIVEDIVSCPANNQH